MFVDSHCHLEFEEFAGQHDALLARMAHNRVSHALSICTTLEGFNDVLALATRYPNVYATVGVHPDNEVPREPSSDELIALASHPRVVAIGETGLDYYRLKGDLAWQRERFRTHIRAARAARKPLVIHTRDAADDTLAIMREERADEAGGVMHCFTETWEVAQAAMEMGFCISFSGIVTFKNAQRLKDVAQRTPLARMLIETDSPYLAPTPHRGKTNEPSYVVHVAEEIARLKGVELAEVAQSTSQNFFSLFRVQ